MGVFDRIPNNFIPGDLFQLGLGGRLFPAGSHATSGQFLVKNSSGNWVPHTLVPADVTGLSLSDVGGWAFVQKSGNYTITNADVATKNLIVYVNATATITLPAYPGTGQIVVVNNGAGVVTVATSSGGLVLPNATIPGTITLGGPYEFVHVAMGLAGGNWQVLSAHSVMTTNGDIMYKGSGTTQRLAAGATGSALVGGTVPAWTQSPSWTGPHAFLGGATGAAPTPQITMGSYYDNAGDVSVSHIDMYGGAYGLGISANSLNIISGVSVQIFAGSLSTPSVNITSGNLFNSGYMRVGTIAAPANTTAGDLTATRGRFGTDGAIGSNYNGGAIQTSVVTAGGASTLHIGDDTANGYVSLEMQSRYVGASGRGKWKFESNDTGFYLYNQSDTLFMWNLTPAGIMTINQLGTGAVQATGGQLSVISDERTKDIKGDYTRGLDAILALKPILYSFNEASDIPDKKSVWAGFGAAQVRESIPEAVHDDNPNGFLSLSDRPIIAALVNAVKELSAKNEALEARLAALEAR